MIKSIHLDTFKPQTTMFRFMIIISVFFLLNFGNAFLHISINRIWLSSAFLFIAMFFHWSKTGGVKIFRENLYKIDTPDIFFCLFISWQLLTGFGGVEPFQAIEKLLIFALVYIIFGKAIPVEMKRPQQLLAIIEILFVISLIMGAVALIMLAVEPSRYYNGNSFLQADGSLTRTGSIYGSPNALGVASLRLFLLGSILFLNRDRKPLIYIIAFSISVINVLISGSKASMLSMVFILFMYVFLGDIRKNHKKKLALIGVFVSMIVLYVSYYASSFIVPFRYSVLFRTLLWKTIASSMNNDLIAGHGIGSAQSQSIAASNKAVDVIHVNMAVTNTHNSFIEVFVESGIVGLLFFSCLIFYIGYKLFVLYMRDQDKVFWGSLFVMASSLIVHSMFEVTLGNPESFTFHLFLLCLAAVKSHGRAELTKILPG